MRHQVEKGRKDASISWPNLFIFLFHNLSASDQGCNTNIPKILPLKLRFKMVFRYCSAFTPSFSIHITYICFHLLSFIDHAFVFVWSFLKRIRLPSSYCFFTICIIAFPISFHFICFDKNVRRLIHNGGWNNHLRERAFPLWWV